MVFVYFENDSGTVKGIEKLKDDKEFVQYVKDNPTYNVAAIYGEDVNLEQILTARGWGFVKELTITKPGDVNLFKMQ